MEISELDLTWMNTITILVPLYEYYLFLLHGPLYIAPHKFFVPDSDCAFIKTGCHIKMWLFTGPHPKATEVKGFMKGSEPIILTAMASHVLFYTYSVHL